MKHIIITGSSRGIGLATALEFLKRENYRVFGTSTSGQSEIENTLFECYPLSLEEETSIYDFVKKVEEKNIKIDALINNAAIQLEKWDNPQLNMTQLKRTFDVNVYGVIELTEKLVPYLNKGAHVINLSSSWGAFSCDHFDEFQPHYKMSKAALNMYTKLLSKRLHKNGMKVSSFDPGWVKTDMGTMDGVREPEVAGKEIVDLVERDIDSGYFWYQGTIRDW